MAHIARKIRLADVPRSPLIACALTLLCFTVLLSGCASSTYLRAINVTPSADTQILSATGQTAQFRAIGVFIQGQRPPTTQDISTSVQWSSLNTAVATVSATGVVTAVGAGKATITASSTDPTDLLSASSNVTVNASTTASRNLTSISILPASQSVTAVGETSQYIAIGNYNADPTTQDLTNLVTWGSSDATVAKITSSGLATAINSGATTITALAVAANGAVISSSSGLSVAATTGVVTLPTVTVFKVGATASMATVTASYLAPTGSVLNPINCAAYASGSACSSTFPVGVTVTLTTPNHGPSPAFGGWSSNCTPVSGDPYTCTVTLLVPTNQTGTVGNVTVGAIFD